jgi:acyl-CoA thioesterase-1
MSLPRAEAAVGLAVAFAVLLSGAAALGKTKIACVGASTTSGDGSSAGHHYPDELQRLVGSDAEVRNFGVSGTTMLRAVSASYWNTPALGQALAYQPDVAIIWFGGNDAKPENWTTHKGEFLGDYEAMIHMFQALPSHARTYVILSLVTRDTEGIPKAVVDGEVIPLVRQAAAETGSGIVDVHDDLADHPEYFPDGIHPNDTGTVAVAKLVFAVISAPADASAPDGAARDALGAETPASVGDVGAEMPPSSSPPPGAEPSPSADGASIMDTAGVPPAGEPDGGASGGGGQRPPRGASSSGGGCDEGGGSPVSPLAWLALLFAFAAARRRVARLRVEISNGERGGQS